MKSEFSPAASWLFPAVLVYAFVSLTCHLVFGSIDRTQVVLYVLIFGTTLLMITIDCHVANTLEDRVIEINAIRAEVLKMLADNERKSQCSPND